MAVFIKTKVCGGAGMQAPATKTPGACKEQGTGVQQRPAGRELPETFQAPSVHHRGTTTGRYEAPFGDDWIAAVGVRQEKLDGVGQW